MTLGLFDQQSRVEGNAVSRGALLRSVGKWNDEHQHQVREQSAAAGDQNQQHKNDANPRDVETGIGRVAVADAAEQRAFADLIETARGGRTRSTRIVRVSVRARSGAARRSGGIVVDRSHLRDHRINLAACDHTFVRIEKGSALVGDGLLQIGHDFRPIRIGCQCLDRLIEIGCKYAVSVVFQLKSVAIEANRDDFTHNLRS